jgi:hypothetical protein
MTRRCCLALATALTITCLTMPASAQHLRSAKVGDRLASLVTGLAAVNGAGVGACAQSGASILYAQFLVPPRVDVPFLGVLGNKEDDNASYLVFLIGTRMVMMIAFDEQDPSVPAAVYADLDGKGLITNIWPAAQAPSLCAVVQQLRYQP